MAEQTKEETRKIAEIFSAQYNLDNGTNFSWVDEKSYQPREPYDFMLFDGKKELGIQLVRADRNDPDREYVRPKIARKVVAQLRKSLEEKQLPPLSIYINFSNPPRTPEEQHELAYILDYFIEQKVVGQRTSYFAFHASYDEEMWKDIRKYINNFDFAPRSDKRHGIMIAFSSSEEFLETSIDDEQRVSLAVKKKEAKFYHEILLLVDAGDIPIDDVYIPFIRKSLRESKIREIWIVNNFLSEKWATRVNSLTS